MAITQAVCRSWKVEIQAGTHLSSHTYKLALFTNAATLDKTITAYTGQAIQGRPVYHALADLLVPVGSEGAAAEVKDEDHGRTGQGDQGQGTEVGDEMEVDTHGAAAGEGDDRNRV